MAKKTKKKLKKKTRPTHSAQVLLEHAKRARKQYEPIIKMAEAKQKMLEQIAAPLKAATKAQMIAMQSALEPLRNAAAVRQRMVEQMSGIIPTSKSELLGDETATDNLYELKKFIPIELNPSTQNYIDKLLDNMGTNSDFYNNAVLNLSHFYIFCIHCMLVKAYKHEERVELLGYLKKTTDYFEIGRASCRERV